MTYSDDPAPSLTKYHGTQSHLRKGWTTGACATAAAKAAYYSFLHQRPIKSVQIRLPRGELPVFDILNLEYTNKYGRATVIKDAGDDPDVTHRAEITVTVAAQSSQTDGKEKILFHAGTGVGKITLPGLPLPPGEAAINPKPREMILNNLQEVADQADRPLAIDVTVSVKNGEEIARKTWNPRLGIVGGISILGTTGIVVPFSCSAWIHSIYRGVDVARANGFQHVAGTTGNQSEKAVQSLFHLPEEALLDMGDFAGGLLKYIRKNPVPHLTIAGGFAKILKLAQGNMDLHSSRSQVNFTELANLISKLGASQEQIETAKQANTAKQVLDHCPSLPLAETVAKQAREVALATLSGHTKVDILIVDRSGNIIAHVT